MADAYRRESAMLAAADRFATRRCDFMLGNSEAVTRELREMDGIPTERTATIYNGVDSTRFKPGDARELRSRYGWNDGDVVFGTVANFFAYKRHCDLITAAQMIHRECPNARFVLAGQDRGELARVRDHVHGTGLQQAVTIIPGIEDPTDLYRAMDVYVCSSQTEGFSNVLLEAMACGKPVIATDVGGNAEAVVHGNTGIIVPPLTPDAIAGAAIALVRAPELRERMGQNGRIRVEQRFSLEQMVRAHEELYLRLTGATTPFTTTERTEPFEATTHNG
jgi:glycosyltransferase involved in cell wall biosynthesis